MFNVPATFDSNARNLFFPENPQIRESVRQKLTAMAAKYPGTDAIQVPAQGQFSRALALDMGTRMCANNDLVSLSPGDRYHSTLSGLVFF